MKFRVIEGGRKALEDKVLDNMTKGIDCYDELDRLRPWGDLHLATSDRQRISEATTNILPFEEVFKNS